MNQGPPQNSPPFMGAPQPPPGQPPTQLPHSSQAVWGLVIAIVAFVAGLIPFAGYIGFIGVILCIRDRRIDDPKYRHGLALYGIVFGSLAVLGAVVWTVVITAFTAAVSLGSCPHVYAFNGDTYQLDGDMASGALFAGAERGDLDRLEHLRAVDGVYHLRVQNDLEEVDHVNSLGILVVDHDADDEVLPTQDGGLLVVSAPADPLTAVDRSGASVLDALATQDDLAVSTTATSGPETDTREVWTLTFARPATDTAVLVLRGRNTPFAEEAFVRYLAEMGQGIGPLFAWVIEGDCPCNRAQVDDEIKRLGLALSVEVVGGNASTSAVTVAPVGPAVTRSQALSIALPPGAAGDIVTIRLGATSRFWSLDQVQLAASPTSVAEPQALAPRRAIFAAGGDRTDVTSMLAAHDDARVVLNPGEHVDVAFDAPPPVPGKVRTAVVSLHGYYVLDIGGAPGVSPAAIIAHRAGFRSLPEFAAELAARSDSEPGETRDRKHADRF